MYIFFSKLFNLIFFSKSDLSSPSPNIKTLNPSYNFGFKLIASIIRLKFFCLVILPTKIILSSSKSLSAIFSKFSFFISFK